MIDSNWVRLTLLVQLLGSEKRVNITQVAKALGIGRAKTSRLLDSIRAGLRARE